jgi:enamine deaminase RidA (YjgF/YER057c/UK114 family)
MAARTSAHSREGAMKSKQIYNPKTLGEPVGPFARAVKIGDILYVSGTSAITHQSGPIWTRPLAPDFETQARQTFENIRRVMEDAGGSLNDIFKITMLLKDRKHFDQIGKLRSEYLPERAYSSTGFITDLIRDDMLIEISAEAYLPRRRRRKTSPRRRRR